MSSFPSENINITIKVARSDGVQLRRCNNDISTVENCSHLDSCIVGLVVEQGAVSFVQFQCAILIPMISAFSIYDSHYIAKLLWSIIKIYILLLYM